MVRMKVIKCGVSYDEFRQMIQTEIRKLLDAGISIRIHRVLKNNSLHYDSLVLQQDGFCISPNFYLQLYYQRYCQGETVRNLAEEIFETWQQSRYQQEKYANLSMEYSVWQEKIICRLVSLEKNQELLNEIPHIPLMDMAIIFCCLVQKNDEGIASIRVTNEMMASWKQDTRSLYETAIDNTIRLFPPRILPMYEVLRQLVSHTKKYTSQMNDEMEEDPVIVTNDIGINGAAVILYPGLLLNIAEQLNDDLYLLPSSIHEMILLKKSDVADEKELAPMVQQVNRECVLAEEILSDSAYYFDRQKKKLEKI